uniref:Uncharacterized protein n=1 Tax=Strix occidentalis caurina TaxID=311401 RepID=A0A8D0F369_STROC
HSSIPSSHVSKADDSIEILPSLSPDSVDIFSCSAFTMTHFSVPCYQEDNFARKDRNSQSNSSKELVLWEPRRNARDTQVS